MARVTGIGGIFHKVADPAKTRDWYARVLGITGEYGAVLPWSREPDVATAYSQIAPFAADSSYFAPSTARFMLNLRVDDLDAFLAKLRAKGIEVLGTQAESYGKFAWILDCDGIKIELWQQIGAAPAG